MTDSYRPYAHVVARSVALLEKKVPGWRGKVNKYTLDMSKVRDCILGQLFGHYNDGMYTLFEKRQDDEGLYGFILYEAVNSIPWDYLNIEWKRQLDCQFLTIELLLPAIAKAVKNSKLQAQQKDEQNGCDYRSGKNGSIVCAIGAGLYKTPRFDPFRDVGMLSAIVSRGMINCDPSEYESLRNLQTFHDDWVLGVRDGRKNFYKLLNELRKKYKPFVV